MQQIHAASPLLIGGGNLPEDFDDGLVKGGIYSLRIDSAPTRIAIILHALDSNLRRNIPCTLITSVKVEDLIRYASASTIGLLQNSYASGRLTLLSMVGDYASNIFRFGPERFIRELETMATPNDGFLIVDHAQLLFTAEDPRVAVKQAEVYQAWIRKTRNSALFLFLNIHTDGSPAYLQCLADYFSGLAALHIGTHGLEIGIDFWGMQQGAIMAKRLALGADDGGLHMRPSLTVNRRRERRAEKDTAAVHRLQFPLHEPVAGNENNGSLAGGEGEPMSGPASSSGALGAASPVAAPSAVKPSAP